MIALALSFALRLAAAAPATPAGPCAAPAEADRAWCASVASRPRLPLPTLEDRAALREVYERPELRHARVDTAGLRRRLAGLWLRILELFGSVEAEQYASVGRTIFLAAALVAAVAGLAAARRRRPARPPSVPTAGAEASRGPVPDRSVELARGALARGDDADALRHAFLAALAALEGAGALPHDRSLTNRELAGRVARAHVALAADFEALGRAFDEAVYGRRPVGAPEAREALDVALRIRAAVGGAA